MTDTKYDSVLWALGEVEKGLDFAHGDERHCDRLYNVRLRLQDLYRYIERTRDDVEKIIVPYPDSYDKLRAFLSEILAAIEEPEND